MILAVLEARCGLSFATAEVYLNIAGGYRVQDPAADMAVAAALVSALSERPVPVDAVAFGEVALSGELRPVAHGALRLKEAGKLGFERAMVPIALAKDDSALRLTGFRTLGQFVDHMLGRGRESITSDVAVLSLSVARLDSRLRGNDGGGCGRRGGLTSPSHIAVRPMQD
ncbi:hypothetical protein WR25_12355 [Diploscapter pachys]|uniref:Lon proteolytic domain-containing protein n=1 Tax=Diploscapter pachys TaxID=2018661 RepID=A0A2A2M4B3_9BILA|nr:hypothetical protein WR25_12355 [Diploscapter pachys]